MSIFLLILGIVLFVGLVIVHELGHFFVAKRNSVEIEEFGIGFPPRAWAKKTKGGWDFSVNWLPIGGFVKLKGENDADKRPGSLGVAPTWVKAKIMLAGVAMNLVVAFVLFTLLAWIGMPQLLSNQFTVKSNTTVAQRQVVAGYVDPGSPAAKAGIRPRDQLLTIVPQNASDLPATAPVDESDPEMTSTSTSGTSSNQQNVQAAPSTVNITSAEALPKLTKAYAGQKVVLIYKHKGELRVRPAQLRTAEEAKNKGILGITPTEFTLNRSTWSAPIVAGGVIGQFTAATFQGLGHALGALFQGDTKTASEQVSGPVGIVVLLRDGSLLGIQFILMIIAIISLTLAIMNVLPIPALDGGRLFVIVLSRLFKRQISEQMEERIVGTSFVLLLVLIGLITIVDVKRFF